MTIENPYLRLMRLHQPVGIWLLLWPCWWAAALAGSTDARIYVLLAVGALLMRSSGCIINDMMDREYDKQVQRTKTRPLASGELSMAQAGALLALLLSLALLVAMLLGIKVVMWAIAAMPLVILYPLMKRITFWPQLFLGLTFNWGAMLGYAAAHGSVNHQALVLYVACIFWTLGYDTIYAFQDLKDDAKAGVKSTARLFGTVHSKNILLMFYIAFAVLFFAAAQPHGWGLAGAAAMVAHLCWQLATLRPNDENCCKKTFSSNALMGWFPLLSILLSHWK